MPIQQLLDLSTGHMTSKDNALLERYRVETNTSDKALHAYPFDAGWTVSTMSMLGGDTVERDAVFALAREEGFSEAFLAVLQHAVDNGATLVRFDRDAEYESGLPVFDWENDDALVAEAPKP